MNTALAELGADWWIRELLGSLPGEHTLADKPHDEESKLLALGMSATLAARKRAELSTESIDRLRALLVRELQAWRGPHSLAMDYQPVARLHELVTEAGISIELVRWCWPEKATMRYVGGKLFVGTVSAVRRIRLASKSPRPSRP